MNADRPKTKAAPRAKECPKCANPVDINRGVCTKCGYMFPWFRLRLYLGGCSVLIALLGILLMALMAIFGVAPEPPV